MRKFEIDEIHCPDRFVTFSLRGDVIGSVAKSLRKEGSPDSPSILYMLGRYLYIAGNLIYGKEVHQDYSKLADLIVLQDSTIENVRDGLHKFELNEVNCIDSFVTVTLRADLLKDFSRCLLGCESFRKEFKSVRSLGDSLLLAYHLIYNQIAIGGALNLAKIIVQSDGKVIESEDDFDMEDSESEKDLQLA